MKYTANQVRNSLNFAEASKLRIFACGRNIKNFMPELMFRYFYSMGPKKYIHNKTIRLQWEGSIRVISVLGWALTP